jgi:hypothetical protein
MRSLKDTAKALVGVFCVLSTSACFVLSETSVVGTYTARAPCGTATLEIKRDHSFLQTVRGASGEQYTRSGLWTLNGTGVMSFSVTTDHSTGANVCKVDVPPITRVERWPRGKTIGPIVVICPDSPHEVDYVQR